MQVILEVISENAVGRRAWLRPGQTIKIGRNDLADLAIETDPQLSGEHFALECSTGGCVLRDLQSANGTMVNGKRVAQVMLQDGDRILAGSTEFAIHATTPVTEPTVEPVAAPVSTRTGAQLERRVLTEQPQAVFKSLEKPLYAILDAARDPMVLATLVHSQEKYESLYEGPKGQQLTAVAPYLVQLQPESPFLESLLESGWGNAWGVFLTCDLDFRELRKHLRRFLMVQTEEGKKLYFRFYDPRVLREFLPGCTTDELDKFFGPIQDFYVEGEDPSEILNFAA